MILTLLRIYLGGVLLLAGALALNLLAKKLGLSTWYDFISNPRIGYSAFLWLFFGYPFLLGLFVYFIRRIFLD